ncbi:RDD family protein [Pseudomonas sp. AA-38]|uniref:RDD family protein n=1 Tax=Pseudomonas sp. AA-38 TaxID=3028807 RepID=UPI0023F64973|nr:RDD family protein [Pseudomonas sp. AA-38]
MDTQNPYQTPQAALQERAADEPLLASRGARLGAVIIDSLLLALITMPISYFKGDFEMLVQGIEPSIWLQVQGILIGMVVFVLINGAWLKRYGQTVGKRICKVRIVDMQGQVPALPGLLLKRYLSVWLVSLIPVAGTLLCSINYLFIFRSDRRCVHDHLAGTRVVAA